jgi:hypothetical protein
LGSSSSFSAITISRLFEKRSGSPTQNGPEARPGKTFSRANIKNFGAWCSGFGISKSVSLPHLDIETRQIGDTIYPLFKGEIIRNAILKITHLPIQLQKPLVKFVQGKNQDAKFYIWPGKLKPEINQSLILINLLKREYSCLASAISEPMDLTHFLKQKSLIDSLDKRVTALLSFISDSTKGEEGVRVEPPVLLEPSVRPYGDAFGFVEKRPLIPIGDSIFNGNPKIGNGLYNHLEHARDIHDIFLRLFGKSD